MSEFQAVVVPVLLGKHPNADNLSIATVKGWQCVVKTEDFKTPEGKVIPLGAYIPIGTILPEAPEWEFLRPQGFRVNTMRLRDYVSQGLLIPAKPEWKEGQDVTKELGVQKYAESIPPEMVGVYITAPAEFHEYTDIQQFNNYLRVFDPNDDVVVTEKIHGTNARYAIIDGKFYVGSHTTCLDPECAERNLYYRISRKFEIEAKLRKFFMGADVEIFGEIYGPGVQELHYGLTEPGFLVFDIMVQGHFQPDYQLNKLERETGLKRTPVLYRGKFNTLVLKHATGVSTLDPATPREGIVMRSENRPNHPQLGRKILKIQSTEYLLRPDRTERP